MGMITYIVIFTLVIVLPLLSFLRSHAILRGGNVHVKSEAKPKLWQRCAEKLIRVIFLFCFVVPHTYALYGSLRMMELRWSTNADAACVSNHCITGIPSFVMVILIYFPVYPSTVLLYASVAIFAAYVYWFYLDGRDRDPAIKRHNTNAFNRAVNFFKFYVYLPYTKWKCYCVREFFSLELVPAYGPLPLFCFPAEANEALHLTKMRAAVAAVSTETELARSGDSAIASEIDDWDVDELEQLSKQGTSLGNNVKELSVTAGANAQTSTETAAAAAAAETMSPQADAFAPVVERTSYFFTAHPHGILPLCSFVNLMSTAVGRDRVLFVDNRCMTAAQKVPPGTLDEVLHFYGGNSQLQESTTSTETGTASPSGASTIALPYVPPIGSISALPPSSQQPNYAKARHYRYNEQSGVFQLLPTRDEAVPPLGLTPAPIPRPKSWRDVLRVRMRAVVATFPFYIPIMREVYLFQGMLDASYETCRRVLEYNNKSRKSTRTGGEGDAEELPNDLNHLLLYPGGASEAFLSRNRGPTYLLLRRRKGFLRLALQTRSALVPCYTFGETDYYEQFETNATHFAAPYEDDDSLYRSRRKAARRERQEPLDASVSTAAGSYSTMQTSYYRNVMPGSDTDHGDDGDRGGSGDDADGGDERGTEDVADSNVKLTEEHKQRKSSAAASPAPRRHKWIEAIQRWFQETFGISLPIVKHLLPKSGVKAATVVGRPIYFHLPEHLARMYSDPPGYYDKEKERQILYAAQTVYIRELENLFYMYAPIYLKDHARRRLIII